MKKIFFSLTTNSIPVLNIHCDALWTEKKVTFKYDDTLYEYNFLQKTFSKKNRESIIRINFPKQEICIELLAEKHYFYMPLLDYDIKKEEHSIYLTYTFESVEKTTNCINISEE